MDQSLYTSKQGQCNFCDYETPREFCSLTCETKAAFAILGNSLKFYDKPERVENG